MEYCATVVTQGIRGALETFGEWLAAAGFEHLSVEKRSHFFRSTASESSGRESDPRQCDG